MVEWRMDEGTLMKGLALYLNLEQSIFTYHELFGIIVPTLSILALIIGIGRFVGRVESRLKLLETPSDEVGEVEVNGNGSCPGIKLCPYKEDFNSLKESLSEVRENVAELKGLVTGINQTVEFISRSVRQSPYRASTD